MHVIASCGACTEACRVHPILQVRVPKEETGMVSDLRYGWKKLRKKGIEVSDKLAEMQVSFKRDLVKEVAAFIQDAQAFRKDWETNGPMVPGLDPMEAVDRLKKFQQMFEVRRMLLAGCDTFCCIPGAWIAAGTWRQVLAWHSGGSSDRGGCCICRCASASGRTTAVVRSCLG